MTPLAFGLSDVGRRRPRNEDAFVIDDELHVYAVADGMGGARGGQVASHMAVDHLQDTLRRTYEPPADAEHPDASMFHLLGEAVRSASAAVFTRAHDDPALEGMGTTLTAVGFSGSHAYLAHVGDSRAYRVRRSRIEQLSEDHTLVNQLVKQGALRPRDAEISPMRHVLARAVGVEPDVLVDQFAFSVEPGDILVLCSDGLSGLVTPTEIRDAVQGSMLRAVPEKLVEMANARGGHDNVTVVVVCVAETEANDERHPVEPALCSA